MIDLWNSRLLLGATALTLLSACGGGGGDVASAPTPAPAPAPSPTPSPAPSPPATPPAFRPVAATIFPEPLYNPDLATVGMAWQHDPVPNTADTRNLRDADSVRITYDQVRKTYQISAPIAGSGTIMQMANYTTYPFSYPSGLPGFHADPSDKNSTNYCCNSLSLSAADQPQSRYRYVSFVGLYAPGPASANVDTIAYGTFAVGQPTKAGEVPISGTARYTGHVFGHFAGDAGATWIEGTSRFNFDFGRALLTGDMTIAIQCMMGCAYDSITYSLTDTQFTRGATTFSGSLATPGAPTNGSFSGMFAGPGAAEMMSQFQLPFFSPEYRRWMIVGGAIAGKRD